MGRRKVFLNFLLVLVCIILAYELYVVFREPVSFSETKAKTEASDKKSKETLAVLPVPPPRNQYSIVNQKDLFRPQRAEWTTPKPNAKEEQPQSAKEEKVEPKQEEKVLEKIKLYGTVIYGNGNKIAILELPKTPEDSKGGFRNIHSGDTVAGYKVADILYDRVVLEKNGEKSELLVRDPKKPKARPTAKPQPAQSAQPAPTEAAKAFQELLKTKAEQTKQELKEAPKPEEAAKKVINTPFGPKVVEGSKTK